ncbi:MAG: PTS sugar transporter subunit IIB [Candidatus Krumholzibacteriota bacterium]|nr:PTS sugar transporter subunit IIB [Candidatus Krumholzibacteriota bacterium]
MLKLFRIDDRLVHAQVVLGWGREIRPDRILVADDFVAADEWERNIYTSAVPSEMKISILSLREAVDQLKTGIFDSERVILLVKGPKDALRLLELGLRIEEINVGGMHFSEGKEKILDNVYIDEDDRKALREMVKLGVTLEARALPGHERVILNSKIV